MKKVVLLIFFVFPFITGMIQKDDIKFDRKTNKVTVNGINAFTLERVGFGSKRYFNVYDSTQAMVIRINFKSVSSEHAASETNILGTVNYTEFVFLKSEQKAEIDFVKSKHIKVAETIVSYKLIVDGKLNSKAVDEFVSVNGTPYSGRIIFK